ncbi:hypothetical protein FRC02_004520 [Tulasnella sp. 418]|nr:hypothetical protein FRC02_004520 [Tulasnella sp. 418]
MAFVAVDPEQWQVDTYLTALFGHCFPPEYRHTLRQRFNKCEQGKRTVREFVRELRSLESKISDINERHLVLRFWYGANAYLRLKWLDNGFDPETSSMDELEREASKYERAEVQRRTEESKATETTPAENRKSRRDEFKEKQWRKGQQPGKTSQGSWRDQQPQKGPEDLAKSESSGQNETKKGKDNRTHQDKKRENGGQAPKGYPKLSKKEKDELRAEGKCFTCKRMGHLGKDCPDRNTLRPDLRSSSVSFAHLERLAQEARGLPVSVMQFMPANDEDFSEEFKDARKEIIRSWLLKKLTFGGPYPGDKYTEEVEGDRFEVRSVRDGALFRVIDKQMGYDTFDIHRSWTEDPDFDVCTMLTSARQVLFEMSAINNDAINRKIVHDFYLEICDLDLEPPMHKWEGETFEEDTDYSIWDIHVDHNNVVTLRDTRNDEHYLISKTEILLPNFDIRERIVKEATMRRGIPHRLMMGLPYPGDTDAEDGIDNFSPSDPQRWFVYPFNTETYLIDDCLLGDSAKVPMDLLWDENFDLGMFIAEHKSAYLESLSNDKRGPADRMVSEVFQHAEPRKDDNRESEGDVGDNLGMEHLHLNAIRGSKGRNKDNAATQQYLDLLERNASKPKDFERVVPRAIVVNVSIAGHPCRALLDTGSLADFVSSKLADQLKLRVEKLEKPLPVQLAVTGSRAAINASVVVDFAYQEISEKRRFDVINLDNYDVILGTPFLFQHKVALGFNPSEVDIGSVEALKVEGEHVAVITSRATDILQSELDKIRDMLKEEARDLCKQMSETELPPYRAVSGSDETGLE